MTPHTPTLDHARTALLALDACNPNGVLLAAHKVSCEVTRDNQSTSAARDYPPLVLLLSKASELIGASSLLGDYASFDAWSIAYRACVNVIDHAAANDDSDAAR